MTRPRLRRRAQARNRPPTAAERVPVVDACRCSTGAQSRYTKSRMSDDQKPIDRRRFFRQGLRELLKPLAQAAEPLNEVVRQLNQLDKFGSAAADPYHSPAAPIPVQEHWHRPPGALPEKQFLETCSRCGQC